MLKHKNIFHLNLDYKPENHPSGKEILKNKTADEEEDITIAPYVTQKRVSNSVDTNRNLVRNNRVNTTFSFGSILAEKNDKKKIKQLQGN